MGNNQTQIEEKNQYPVEMLQKIEEIIFRMNENNISETVELSLYHNNQQYPYSFKLIICQLIYSYFKAHHQKIEIIIEYIKTFQCSETNKETTNNIINIFTNFLFHLNTQESNYILEKLIEHNIIEEKMIRNIKSFYFIHYKTISEIKLYQIKHSFEKEILDNYEKLSNNNFELHKQLIKEGHNPNEIAKIIRNDEIEKLQEISSQTKFDFNQTIEPSPYERCSFINKENVSLIDYTAFFSAIKCFKYLLINGAKVGKTGKYAIAGGNFEIIHLCEQNHSSFGEAYETAIKFHKNDIFKYLYENKIGNIKNFEDLGRKCTISFNYEIFSFLRENGMKINEFHIRKAAIKGNLYLVKYFLRESPIPYALILYSTISGNIELVKYTLELKGIDINAKNKNGDTALILASVYEHTEIVKLLLEQEGIDTNAKNDDGKTALMYASREGYTEIVSLLLEQNGIDVNAKDEKYGWSALMYTSREGYIEIVKLLLEQEGIDINAKDYYENHLCYFLQHLLKHLQKVIQK